MKKILLLLLERGEYSRLVEVQDQSGAKRLSSETKKRQCLLEVLVDAGNDSRASSNWLVEWSRVEFTDEAPTLISFIHSMRSHRLYLCIVWSVVTIVIGGS